MIVLVRSCDNCGDAITEKDEILCEKCKRKNSDAKARAMVARRTTYQLIADWEEIQKKFTTLDIFRVRKWLMDELKRRDEKAFSNWLDSSESSPRKFYIGE